MGLTNKLFKAARLSNKVRHFKKGTLIRHWIMQKVRKHLLNLFKL